MLSCGLTLDEVLTILRARDAGLHAPGIARLSVFGSLARGEAGPDSDVDPAAVLSPEAGWSFFDRCDATDALAASLGARVDLVKEPGRRRPRLQGEIERDRVVAF